MASTFMLYGATGFTGELTARLAVQRGLRPVVAGRNPDKVQALARELRLNCSVFDLTDGMVLEEAVSKVDALLNCAGPFLHTAKPLMEACLKVGRHYLDISGEIPVFEMFAARDADASKRGVTFLPGVAIEIAATDCLAAHLKRRLPSATHLALAWSDKGPVHFSRGSTKTILEYMDYGCRIRRNGRLEAVPMGWKSRLIDLGYGPVKLTTFPWPDVFTAYYSTGIPNIEVYFPYSKQLRRMSAALRYLHPLLRLSMVRNWIKRSARNMPPGPNAAERAQSRGFVWGQVTNEQGGGAVSRLEGPEPGYTWTPIIALDAVQKVLAGLAPTGFQTPSLAFGADFIMEAEEVTRVDLA